jgi:hypothetical protein
MWAFAWLVGCPTQPLYPGVVTYELFPFDCERTWEFTSTDTTLAYKLAAVSDTPPEPTGDGTNVYTLRYVTQCLGADPDCVDGDVDRKIQWSSTVGDGVHVHGFALGDEAITKFDPPMQLALENMKKALDPENPGPGEFAETITNGATWRSVLTAIEACPVKMAVDWDECYRFEVTTDGGDGIPVAGTWWAIAGQGVVAFEVAGDSGQWQASFTDQVESEEMGACDGTW